MATVSKSFTENSSMMGTKATWTVTLNGADQTVSGDFTLTFPTTTAKYVGSDKGRAWCNLNVLVKCGSSSTTQSFNMYPTNGDYTSWASNTVKTLPIIRYDYDNRNITLSNIFKSSNKTERTVSVTAQIWQFYAQSDNSSNTNPNEYWGGYDYISYGQIATVTLNAPPTVTCGTPTYSNPQYAGLGSYSVPITEAKALYGGDVSSITLTVGNDSITQNYSSATVSSQTISLTPSVAGTYTPTITVTDSRGQVTTTNLPQITVYSYTAPSMNFDLARCDSSGVPQAEGEYGLVTANISYVDAIAELTQPTVSVKDEGDNTIISSTTWYTTWNATNGVSNAVNWTNYNPTSPVTLYGVVSATGSVFSPNESYTVSITPTDNMGGVASTITQTLATGFFTIDFQAGGKEIAFGAPANDDLTLHPNGLFKCDMDAWFNGNVHIQGGGSGTSTPTADTTAQWDSDVHMNSEDMTSQEVDDFVDNLNISGGGQVIVGLFSPNTGTSYLSVREYGKTVTINGWLKDVTLTANTNTYIGSISGVDMPPDVVRAYCNVGSNAYTVGTLSYLGLGTNGRIEVTSSNGGSGKALYFCISYIA